MKKTRVLPVLFLSILLLSVCVPNVHGSVLFLWAISNATQGENTNCHNDQATLGNVPGLGTIENIGIIADSGSFTNKILTSVTVYLMFQAAPTTSDDITIGTFLVSSGALVNTLSTIPHGTIPLCTGQPPVSFTVTGQITIHSGEYVGIQYLGRNAGNVGIMSTYFDYNCGLITLPAVTEYNLNNVNGIQTDGDHCPAFGEFDGQSVSSSNVDPATKSIALILPFIFVAIGAVTMMSGTKKSGMGQNNGSDIISYGFAAILIGVGVVMIANIIAGL